MLVDGRHAPTDDDIQMYQWLAYYQLPVLVVATKMDKVKGSRFTQTTKLVQNSLNLDQVTPLVLFSAKTKRGKDQVWQWIEQQTGVK